MFPKNPVLVIIAAVLIASCSSDDNSPTDKQTEITEITPTTNEELAVTTSTAIIGTLDLNNSDSATNDITVSIRDTAISTRTQADGSFELELPIDQDPRLITLDITGPAIVAYSINVPISSQADRVMVNSPITARSPAIPFNLENGGVLQNADSPNRTSVSVPANAFVHADGSIAVGSAEVSITEIDIKDLHGESAWAPNLVGIPAGMNEPTAIWSYGMSDFHFSQNGQDLQLREGVTATIKMDLPTTNIMTGSQGDLVDATPGATMPLWHYDTVDAIWKEEGTSTVNADAGSTTGFSVSGDVSHFSTWNIDRVVPAIPATVEVVLVNLYGEPRHDISVTSYRTIARIPPSDGPGWHDETSYQNEEMMTPDNNSILVLANLANRAEKIANDPKYTGYTEMEIIVDDIMTTGYPEKINTESIMVRKRFNDYDGDTHVVIEVLVADF